MSCHILVSYTIAILMCNINMRVCTCIIHSLHIPAVRLSALDLVKSFLEEEDLVGPCYSAIIFAINKHLEENPPNTTAHWWKASVVLLCSVLVGVCCCVVY